MTLHIEILCNCIIEIEVLFSNVKYLYQIAYENNKMRSLVINAGCEGGNNAEKKLSVIIALFFMHFNHHRKHFIV